MSFHDVTVKRSGLTSLNKRLAQLKPSVFLLCFECAFHSFYFLHIETMRWTFFSCDCVVQQPSLNITWSRKREAKDKKEGRGHNMKRGNASVTESAPLPHSPSLSPRLLGRSKLRASFETKKPNKTKSRGCQWIWNVQRVQANYWS